MRYLYHLTEGNRGPVTFEQLQELAKAGTIDNMTPVLAEGAREWSRWLFIKNTPPTAADRPSASAPAAKQMPTPAAKPAPVVKAASAPAPKPAPVVKAASAPAPKPAEEPQKKEAPLAAAKPAPEVQPVPAAKSAEPEAVKQAPAPAAKAPAPQEVKPAPAPAPTPEPIPAGQAPARPLSLRDFCNELNLVKLIPTGICAVVTLLALLSACFRSVQVHDAEEEYAAMRDLAAAYEQSRPELENLAATQQQVQAETLKLEEDMIRQQEKLKLTKEESERLAKGPYISEAEAKQLKDEQVRAARLKEQEQKL